MNATIQAFRAVTAAYFRTLLLPLSIIAGVIVALLYAGVGWLVSQNGWWGLVFLILIPMTILGLFIILGLWTALRFLQPRVLDRSERKIVKDFTSKITGLVEQTGTPYPLIGFYIAKDVLRRRESSYIKKTIGDSVSLKADFTAVRRIFESK